MESPAFGVKIKINWPNITGGWARGYHISGENDNPYFGIGGYGMITNGVSSFERGWIGKGYDNAYMNFLPNGNVGVGTDSPQYPLDVVKYLRIGAQGGSDVSLLGGGGGIGSFLKLFYADGRENTHLTGNDVSWINAYVGNVGIGTTTPQEKLSVNGNIRSKEIKVEMSGWPDYVFDDGYKTQSLSELENYIKTNKHLPDMPSAREIEVNGVAVGDMLKLQQKKIEELTLYLIEKDKIISKIEQENSATKLLLNEIIDKLKLIEKNGITPKN